MTHSYQISGMTCNGCVAKVKDALLRMPDVLSADISLPDQATIEMQKHISLPTLQQAIGAKYTITETASMAHHMDMPTDDVEKSWIATYKPLLIVFAFITGVSAIAAHGHPFMHWMGYFMAGFFLVFSFFKMLDISAFADSYSSYDLLAKKWRGYGFIYPFIELALGIAYLTGFDPFITNIATIVVMGFSSIGVIQSLVNKRKIQCACLGAVFNLPMSTVTVVEDLLMVAMAAIMLAL
ncbi:heavy-metal-associated domain-containing protein [Taibaiella soli]|uniref:Heavy-metal-associated domain-containing protein n=1 Tax=Taibaiella soli TaxID=1649169 RepID=A0A2W2B5Z0_9BACT|nr:heavy metal-associated domain-containing protein [Taibaiella soli]PZF71397.1 heavy-metal-associated domain-containing protein [Taibaiella soli]